MDFVAVGGMLKRFFENNGIDYAVIGGFGLLALGIERVTFDLDFVTVRDCQDELVLELERQGYDTLHRSEGYSNHLHPDNDFGRVDIVYVGPSTAGQLFASTTRVEVLPGFEVAVPKPEHLAAMKARALKNDPTREQQDLADIRRLMDLPGSDRGEVQRYFEALGLGRLFAQIAEGSD